MLDDVDAVGNSGESAGDATPLFVTEMFDEDEWDFTVNYAVNNFFSTIPPDDRDACIAAANALILSVTEIIGSIRFVDAISPVFAFGKSPAFSESDMDGNPISDIFRRNFCFSFGVRIGRPSIRNAFRILFVLDTMNAQARNAAEELGLHPELSNLITARIFYEYAEIGLIYANRLAHTTVEAAYEELMRNDGEFSNYDFIRGICLPIAGLAECIEADGPSVRRVNAEFDHELKRLFGRPRRKQNPKTARN